MTNIIALAALAAAQAAAVQAVQPAPQAVIAPAEKSPAQDPPSQTTQIAPAWQAPMPAPSTDPATPVPMAVPAVSGNNPVAAPADIPVTPPASVAAKGAILWRNIESGMHVAQLRALYPEGPNVHYKADRTVLSDVPILEGCQAKVNVMHQAGVVKEIVMRGEGAIAGRCSLKIITALSGKYGEPLEKDKVHGSLFARQGKNYVWMRDGVTLQFKRYTSGPLGGGGLFAASWELRYSASATNIDL